MAFPITLVIFGVVFYTLMRLGCGARLVHGLSPKPAGANSDPVCGMKVSEIASFTTDHDGTTYRFCSASCRDRFRRHPQAFLEEP